MNEETNPQYRELTGEVNCHMLVRKVDIAVNDPLFRSRNLAD
jgi:hypothetical protein